MMKRIDALIHWFAATLATSLGFLGIMLTLLLGFLIGIISRFGESWSLLFNMYLSIVAIVIAATILVAQKRDTNAIQAKLNHLILSGDSHNQLVGIEKSTVKEIEDIRDQQHADRDT